MWYTGIFEQLEQMVDISQSRKMSAYMQNKYQFLGVPKPKLKAFIKPYLKNSKKYDYDWSFVFLCWEKPYREAQYIAIEYVLLHQKSLTEKDLDHLKIIITKKAWWDTVDSLDSVVGSIVMKNPDKKNLMLEWSASDNIWLKRVAIDFQQKYKENTDTDLMSQIILNNAHSKEFFVQKAIGWSLRDYSKINPAWVINFLETNKNELSPLSIMEASKYL